MLLLTTVAVTTVVGKNSVLGTIDHDTTWFLSNLSVCPAMMASLEYHVQYLYVERNHPFITPPPTTMGRTLQTLTRNAKLTYMDN